MSISRIRLINYPMLTVSIYKVSIPCLWNMRNHPHPGNLRYRIVDMQTDDFQVQIHHHALWTDPQAPQAPAPLRHPRGRREDDVATRIW